MTEIGTKAAYRNLRAAPTRAPTAPPKKRAPDLRALLGAKQKHIHDYLHFMKNNGNKPAGLLILGAAQQPGFTRATAHAKTTQYLDNMAKMGNKPAKVILFAATKDFHTKMKAAAA